MSRTSISGTVSGLLLLTISLSLPAQGTPVGADRGGDDHPPVPQGGSRATDPLVGFDKGGRNDALTGLDQIGPDDAWAVGWHAPGYARYRNLILHWDGVSWSKVAAPQPGKTRNGLGDVAAVDADDIWTVGTWADSYDGFSSTLAEHWDGSTWAVVPTPSPGEAGNDLSAVSAVASDDVWAVGSVDTDFDGGQAPLAEHWDGSTWTVVDVPALPGNGYFTDVSATSSDDVWIVGRTRIGQRDHPVSAHFDGVSWTLARTPKLGRHGGWFDSVTAVSPMDAWAVGSRYDCGQLPCVRQTLIERWDGTHWSLAQSAGPGTRSNELYAVTARTSHDVWAVGGWTSPPDAGALIEHWDGHSWTVSHTSPTKDEADLMSVDALTATDALTVGSLIQGTASRNLGERWNGSSWRRVTLR